MTTPAIEENDPLTMLRAALSTLSEMLQPPSRRAGTDLFRPGEPAWGIVEKDMFPECRPCSGRCGAPIAEHDYVLVLPAFLYGVYDSDAVIHADCFLRLTFGPNSPNRMLNQIKEQIVGEYVKKN